MFRIDTADAAESLPIPFEEGTQGFFRPGSAAGGQAATEVTADWLNAVQETLVGPIVAAGLSLAKGGAYDLLAKAIPLLAQPAGMHAEIAGVAVPSGWLQEDGSVVNEADYPRLFARIGHDFNTGGEDVGTFRLPDRAAASGFISIIKV